MKTYRKWGHSDGGISVYIPPKNIPLLHKPDYVTFGYMYLLSQIRLSSVTFVHPTQLVEIFGNVSTSFCTIAIR